MTHFRSRALWTGALLALFAVSSAIVVLLGKQGQVEQDTPVAHGAAASTEDVADEHQEPDGLLAAIGNGEDPCRAVREILANELTIESVHRLTDVLAASPAACWAEVPIESQVQVAELLCANGEGPPIPGSWAVKALDKHLIQPEADHEVAACLAGRAAEGAGEAASELARCLAAYEARVELPALELGQEPDPKFLELVLSILRTRAQGDREWWQEFWKGMSTGGVAVRAYLYFAIGQVGGTTELLSFVTDAVGWEDTATPAGVETLTPAGSILRRYQAEPPPVAQLVPDSPRMRLVMVEGVPFRFLGIGNEKPWFGSDEAQARLRQIWDEPGAGPTAKADLAMWRANYIANEWSLAGPNVASQELESALGSSDSRLEHFNIESRLRFSAALKAYGQYSEHRDAAISDRAPRIRLALETAIRKATPRAITELIYGLGAHLMNDDFRARFSALIQDRLPELPERVQGRVTR